MIDKNGLMKLLALDNKMFVEEAYRKILLRDADKEGLETKVNALEQGVSKEQMLFELRTSEEGIKKEVEFSGFNIREIEIGRLLAFEGCLFVEAAYLAVLGRIADENGKLNYLESIYTGKMNKIDVLYALRFSEEGIRLGIDVKGLVSARKKQQIKRFILCIPFVGRIIRFLWNLVHINRTVNVRMGTIMQSLGKAEQHLARTEQRLKYTEQHVCEMEQCLNSMKQHKYEMQCEIDSLNLDRIKQQRINKLTTGSEYKKYEDEMRGSREEIIGRLNIYEAIVKKVKANNGERLFALDLGCGRGEWLELMERKYHITAVGVDSDESMLNDSRKFGLNVVNADLMAYVKSVESNSVDIITMFQVAEHLPVSILLDTLNECFRVLRKGGAIIVETPNPENLIIGACNFYFDPTHITKLPPALLKIFIENIGMSDAEIVRMHLYKAIDVDKLEQDNAAQNAIKQMAIYFNNYADYAVTAFKK